MDKLGNRNFRKWMAQKETIHNKKPTRTFKVGELWWCRIGENVGSEICGKGNDYLRPIIIVAKLSKTDLIGVPLTSQGKTGSWYVEFEFRDKLQRAVLVQVENISMYRLHHKMGEVPESDLNKVLAGLRNLFREKNKS